jgi:hypothetical protein
VADDSEMFWGVKYYNEDLLPAGPEGSVQSDLLFAEECGFSLGAMAGRFRTGDVCVLPSPQDLPSFPSSGPALNARLSSPLLVLVVSVASSLVLF